MRRALVLVLLAIAIYAGILLRDAGVLTTLVSQGLAGCRSVSGIPGPEDLVRIGDNGVLISSVAFPRLGDAPEGALYYLDLASPTATPKRLAAAYPTGFHPHGLDAIASGDGAFEVGVVNHAHSSEGEVDEVVLFSFNPKSGTLVFQKKIADPLFGNSLNDLVFTAPDSFYATRDHAATTHLGKTAEDFLRLGQGSITHFDGSRVTEVYRGIAFANGIVRLPSGEIVVASMLGRKVIRFAETEPGVLKRSSETALGAGPDNLFYDAEKDTLWIGAHPKLLKLKKASQDSAARSPSMVLRIPNYGANPKATSEKVLVDETGGTISALSTAITQAGKLVLGAIYGDQILVCPRP